MYEIIRPALIFVVFLFAMAIINYAPAVIVVLTEHIMKAIS